MHVPTIYNTDIDESYDELVLNDDKLHHLINVLRIRNNSPCLLYTSDAADE